MRKNNALQAVCTDNKDQVLDTRLERGNLAAAMHLVRRRNALSSPVE